MRGWTKRVALAGLLSGLALGAGACRLETSTLGKDAQPRMQQGTGGAGGEGQSPAAQTTENQAPATPGEVQHGEGLGNVIDGHGYERHRQDGATPEAESGPVNAAPESGGH